MDILIEFLINNYIWCLVILLIIIFALIGYLVDMTNNVDKKVNKVKPISIIEDDKVNIHPSVEKYTSGDFDDPLIKD